MFSRMKIWLFLPVLLSPAAFSDAQPRTIVAGTHYQELPQSTLIDTETDKIEITELFWYGCPECKVFNPLMTTWKNGNIGDLIFFRNPAVWNELMELHAKLFYTAEALGVTEKIHPIVYRTIHKDGNPLTTEEDIHALFVNNGVSSDSFEEAWNSPSVMSAVSAAAVRTQSYEPDKVPSVIVGGRYRVSLNNNVKTGEDMLITVNLLIKKIRDTIREH